MSSYNEKQMEAANLLSGSDVPSGVVEEIVRMMEDQQSVSVQPPVQESVESIKIKMMDEKDWRKRASLAAMLISRSLD